jgi:hypothetical protein
MRKCKICQIEKHAKDFYKDSRVKKDGLRSRCIDCLTNGLPPGPVPVYPLNNYKVNDRGCWIWQGSIGRHGYGQIKWKNKSTVAHRVIYEIYKGIIPEGLILDHLCSVKSCVNPDHLEAVTFSQNSQRAWDRNHCATCTCILL